MVLGLILPWFALRRKARARATAIHKRLPDAIDLIITNIEAGLGLQAALLTVSERMNGPTAKEYEIGREHVCTPVTNAQRGCRHLQEKNKSAKTTKREHKYTTYKNIPTSHTRQ